MAAHPLLHNLAEFALAYGLILALPGANFVIVAQASATSCRRAALAAALGIGSGATLLAAAALAGANMLAADPRIATIPKLLLAAILVAIGLKALRRACLDGAGRYPPKLGQGGYYCIGLIAALTNPVTAAFFVSATVNAGLPSAGPTGWLLLPLVFLLATSWFGTVALTFSLARVRLAYERWRRMVDFGIGAILATLGLTMGARLLVF